MSKIPTPLINYDRLLMSLPSFHDVEPFNHCIIDEFFPDLVARALEEEFMSYDSDSWYVYDNLLEHKKASNNWNSFPEVTYSVFRDLLSARFVSLMEDLLGCGVYVDPGLHGGGWHIHGAGGNLNPHLDYSIHPKMRLMRKLNVIVYLSSDLEESHGGHLGLWAHDGVKNMPGMLVKEIEPKFNRAVLFDTTQNSWHGMSRCLSQPLGIYRKSIAVYYLIDPPSDADRRERALYAPRSDQVGDENILDLIRTRSDAKNFHKAYKISK